MAEKNKLIVVTGGAGFIGSHLCARLVKEGHQVISLDNYFTGSRDNHIEGVEYREGHTKDIAAHIPETPDLIYHLGEYSRVAKSLEEPTVVFDLNIEGTFGVLEFCRTKKTKLVYAGSSTKFVGARADGVEGRDLAPYTWAKAANSELVSNYAHWYGFPYAITYFYNVYGPGERAGTQQYGTFIGMCKDAFLGGKPLTVRSPGSQKRAFTHIDDTVDALVLIGEKGEGDEYGIGAKEVYSLRTVAEMFGGKIEMLPETPTTRSEPGTVSTQKTQALGWSQKHTLAEYISEIQKNA